MDLGIVDKRVLVTAASQGIGQAIALAFAQENCRVAVVARRKQQLKQLVDDMGGPGKGHSFCAIDLMPPGNPTAALEKLDAEADPFDIVIHNIGGTLQVKNPLAPVSDWQDVWRFNVGIAIEINGVVAAAMQKKQWGRIIHISSISGESLRGSGPYGAAKAYLNAYTKVLGRALAPTGVVVSAVLPGAIYAPGGHWDNVAKTNPAMKADFLRHHHAIGRLGTAEEIAPFAVFLASKYVTFAQGACINVDGGTM